MVIKMGKVIVDENIGCYSKSEGLASKANLTNYQYNIYPGIGLKFDLLSVLYHPSTGDEIFAIERHGMQYLISSKSCSQILNYNIGDKVEITDIGETYNSYTTFADSIGLTKYNIDADVEIQTNVPYKVLAKISHPIRPHQTIVVLESVDGVAQFLVNSKGVIKFEIKEETFVDIKLPNIPLFRYTGEFRIPKAGEFYLSDYVPGHTSPEVVKAGANTVCFQRLIMMKK
jgi:hypothetical protein